MLYNVAQLLKEDIGASRRYSVDGLLYDVDVDGSNREPARVWGSVNFLRTEKGILAIGQAHLRLVQPCRRCLELTERDICFDFEEEFLPSVDVKSGVRLATPDAEAPELVIDEHHMLDLTEVLRQYAVLAASDGVLCRPDCKGLCPICGCNLNLGSCHCDATQVDPRFAVLAEMLRSPAGREEDD